MAAFRCGKRMLLPAAVIGADFFNKLFRSQDLLPVTQLNEPPVALAIQQKIQPGCHVFLFVRSNMPSLPKNIIVDLHLGDYKIEAGAL